MAHTRASLNALKVGDLRELCTQAGLPTSGVKADLVTRLLDHQSAPEGAPPAQDAATGVSSQPVAAADGSAPAANGGVTAEAQTADDQQAALDAELAKRKARAERFGVVEPAGEEVDDPQKKLDRIARFGIESTGPPAGLGALDMALDDLKGKRGRGGKQRRPKDASAAAPSAKAGAAAAAPTPAHAEWEEKKRKRAERFGGAPADDAATKRPKA